MHRENNKNHLVWTPTFKYVAEKIRENKQLQLIIAPFIKRNALNQLLDVCENTSNLQVIVRWSAKDIINGVSDIEIYEDLKEKNIRLFRHPDIHLKMLVFNKNWAFHTSGNITHNGLGLKSNPNIEVGAQIQLECKDWIEIYKLLEQSTLIDSTIYERACQYKEKNKVQSDPLPPIDLRPKENKAFSKLSLPAVQSPEKLYELYKNIINFDNQDELFRAFTHDIALYNIISGLEEKEFYEKLQMNFSAHPFIQAVVNYVKENKSSRFTKINNWITAQCSDKPMPYRWEIKETTSKLYNWLAFHFKEITWKDRRRSSEQDNRYEEKRPEDGSQVIFWEH